MINSTLCYLERGDEWLLLHRTRKENDLNKDKWIGIGGKFEDKESPEECLLREVKEETGLTLTGYAYRGIVTFVSDIYETEYMHLFTSSEFTGEITDCDEGELSWIRKKDFADLQQWEGDRIFLRLLEENEPFFSLKLQYQGESLVYAAKNGKPMLDRREDRFPKGICFFDLDGTLLDNKTDSVCDSALFALSELKKNGYIVCLSTGRDMDTHYSRKYRGIVNPDAIIHHNGTKITVGDQLLFDHQMDRSLLRKAVDYAMEKHFCMGTSVGDYDYYTYPEMKTEADRSYSKIEKLRNFRDIEDLFTENIPVSALSFAGVHVSSIKDIVEKDIPEFRLFAFNSDTGADVVEEGFSKAAGMEKICSIYGVPRENTYAFGDSANDIPMLIAAGTGVAVGGSSGNVIAAADMVTDPIDEDGIYHAVKKLGLIG